MKSTQYMLALALAAAPSGAYAQSSVANATFALTETYTAPSLQEKDENGKAIKGGDLVYDNEFTVETSAKTVETSEHGSKMTVAKISNKEILGALVDAHVIPGIAGWSIVLVNSDQDTPSFAATNGTQYIMLDEFLSLEANGASAETSNYKQVTTTVFKEAGDVETVQETGSNSGKALISIGFNVNDTEANLSGIASYSSTLKTIGKGEDAYTQWVDGPVKVNSISGFFHDPASEDDSVIEGTISAAAAKLINL